MTGEDARPTLVVRRAAASAADARDGPVDLEVLAVLERLAPQPCFTTAQVEALIEKATGEEKAALALMAYAGLRIGEVEQLRWEDLRENAGRLPMIHVRRGGSDGSTKDRDDRFVPLHPQIASRLPKRRRSGPVFESRRGGNQRS